MLVLRAPPAGIVAVRAAMDQWACDARRWMGLAQLFDNCAIASDVREISEARAA
jgi:hypothetical protein